MGRTMSPFVQPAKLTVNAAAQTATANRARPWILGRACCSPCCRQARMFISRRLH